MSQRLLNRSPDLQRLQAEGFDLEIRGTYLLVKQVPYVTPTRAIAWGTLVCALSINADATTKPATHVAFFIGEHPCHKDGTKIHTIEHQSQQQNLGAGILVDHSFSTKPQEGYSDYFEKVTTYVAIISSPAEALDANVTARTFPVLEAAAEDSVFCYLDTASTRAQIAAVSEKLRRGQVAIVGLGGAGADVLDLVEKTPVRQVHLYDSDGFVQHNAFRSPGAPALETLRGRPRKVDYFAHCCARMHRGVVPHQVDVNADNVAELQAMDFVFLCLDRGEAKAVIVAQLEAFAVPFVDVGMGVFLEEHSLSLGGQVRVTTSTVHQRAHVRTRVSFGEGDAGNEYRQNIQIADLNALNAALAVIKWKKLWGFYLDLEREHQSTYIVDGNSLLNEDHA